MPNDMKSARDSFFFLHRTRQSWSEGGGDSLHSAPSPGEEPTDAGTSYETLGKVSWSVDAPFTVLQIQQRQRL